jgi:hypothetical protein
MGGEYEETTQSSPCNVDPRRGGVNARPARNFGRANRF